jgi:Lsr2
MKLTPDEMQEHDMAQQIQVLFTDDIDGGEAAGTVRFALDGVEYEIDLSTEHTDELHTALGKYVDHARKVGGSRRTARGSRRSASAIDTHKVREWAREEGIEIKDRGRVPANIVEQYKATTGA